LIPPRVSLNQAIKALKASDERSERAQDAATTKEGADGSQHYGCYAVARTEIIDRIARLMANKDA
jgi:hypothetical protein